MGVGSDGGSTAAAATAAAAAAGRDAIAVVMLLWLLLEEQTARYANVMHGHVHDETSHNMKTRALIVTFLPTWEVAPLEQWPSKRDPGPQNVPSKPQLPSHEGFMVEGC